MTTTDLIVNFPSLQQRRHQRQRRVRFVDEAEIKVVERHEDNEENKVARHELWFTSAEFISMRRAVFEDVLEVRAARTASNEAAAADGDNDDDDSYGEDGYNNYDYNSRFVSHVRSNSGHTSGGGVPKRRRTLGNRRQLRRPERRPPDRPAPRGRADGRRDRPDDGRRPRHGGGASCPVTRKFLRRNLQKFSKTFARPRRGFG